MYQIRRNPGLWAILFVLATGCGGASSCACGGASEPLAAPLPQSEVVYDGILTEITPQGLGFIEQNFSPILQQAIPGGLTFSLPAEQSCKASSTSCRGSAAICRSGAPCPINSNLKNIGFSTVAPNRLRFSGQVDVTSGNIPVQFCQKALLCISASCDIRVTVSNKPISADVVFGVDPVTQGLTFKVENVGLSVVGSDFRIDGGLLCDIADWGFVRDTIASVVNSQMKALIPTEVQKAIDDSTCMPCDFYSGGCGTVGAGVACNTSLGRCMNAATGQCVRSPMGSVSRSDMGAATGLTGGPAYVDMSIYAGQQQAPGADPIVAANGAGLSIRTLAGTASELSPCVPDAAAPSTAAPPRINFATEAAGDTFMVGLGLSDAFLDNFFYDFYRSGAMCWNVGADTSAFISSGVLGLFMPSLNSLTEGRDVPMMLAFRPKASPHVEVGAGTYSTDAQGNRVLVEPLLTIHMPDMNLEFFALIDDRMVRLFALNMDIALPLGLEFNANNEVVPIFGDLGALASNITAEGSELLAEDPATLEQLIPALIGFIEPALAGAVAPVALPDLQGFGLKMKAMRGMVPAATAGTFEHIGILADLTFTPTTPLPAQVATTARLVGVELPSPEAIYAGEASPAVRVSAQAYDARRDGPGFEWQYRVDGGLWSPFQPSGELLVRSPKFMLQGRHTVEVRARALDDYRTLDGVGATLEALIDWEAPRARLSIDPATGVAALFAQDAVSPAEALEYSFAADNGSYTSWSKASTFDLPPDAREVSAQVRDEAGNTRTLSWRGPDWVHGSAKSAAGGCGCAASASGSAGLGLWALGLLGLWRRRRS